MKRDKATLNRLLGKELRRHLCSVVTLAFRYQHGIWNLDSDRRAFHQQSIRDLDSGVKSLTRMIQALGVSLPQTAGDIEQFSYLSAVTPDITEPSDELDLQVHAESRLQKALGHTKKLAYDDGRDEIVQLMDSLTQTSVGRTKFLETMDEWSEQCATTAGLSTLAFA